jgi:hypothetical protein
MNCFNISLVTFGACLMIGLSSLILSSREIITHYASNNPSSSMNEGRLHFRIINSIGCHS